MVQFLGMRVQSLKMVPACWLAAVRSLGKALMSGQNLSSTRAHKDSIRTALVSSRGAITMRRAQSGLFLEMFSATSMPHSWCSPYSMRPWQQGMSHVRLC
eukprot:1159942-Pelagomonas_calceolata.AAC.15